MLIIVMAIMMVVTNIGVIYQLKGEKKIKSNQFKKSVISILKVFFNKAKY